MKITLLFIVLLSFQFNVIAQEITGSELLEKAIAYHDPNGNWSDFSGSLFITMKSPKNDERKSEVHIDLPSEFFSVEATRGDSTTAYILEKDNCKISFNGSTDFSEEILKENNLSCERAKLFKNYYTYLYGLPMKLKDPGTIIDQKTMLKKFMNKEYQVLKVTYNEDVGKDVWYFYFDPETSAMEVYQFFHDETKNDGEYILLTDETTINGIKIPRNRAWYKNTDDTYLGTDHLDH